MPAPMSGTMRALVNNMVTGVTKGFEKKLTTVGVGSPMPGAQGDKLNLSLGFSHPVVHEDAKRASKCETPTQTEIVIKGCGSPAGRPPCGRRDSRISFARSPYRGKGRPLYRQAGDHQGKKKK